MKSENVTVKDELAAKYAKAKVDRMIKKHEKMVGDYFDSHPPTEREKDIYNVYEGMKPLIARYPQLLENLHEAYMKLFEVLDATKVKVGKEVIIKKDVMEDMEEVRSELALKLKIFEKIETFK